MKKIPCLVLIYDNVEIIKRSINSLLKYRERLTIHIIENPSAFTEHYTKPSMQSLLYAGLIDSYTLFDANITNNAFEEFLRTTPLPIWDSEFILLTDGDVVAEGEWLESQINILNKYKDVFCCSVKMSLDGWSQGLKDRFGPARSENQDYIEVSSGIWLCLFRTQELKAAFNLFTQNKFRFRDGPLLRFVYEYWRKKWVVSKFGIARELTRSGFSNPDYRKNKNALILQRGNIINFWNHDEICGFHTYTKNSVNYLSPQINKETRPEIESPNCDWLAPQLANLPIETLYFGVNIKNKILGKATLGNSDTRSFYDKDTNTCHIRANIYEELPNIRSAFKTVVFFMLLHRFDEINVKRFLNFAHNALIDDGRVRVVLPNDSYNDTLHERSLSNQKIINLMQQFGFIHITETAFSEDIDLLPPSRYDYKYILEGLRA